MANLKAAFKAIRTSKRNYLRNRALRRRLKNWRKKLDMAILEKKITDIPNIMKFFMKVVDKSAKRNLIHNNKAARIKSGYQKKVNQAVG